MPILAYYNPKKATVLQTDVSIKGLGACLLQEERPAYFASKALTEAQRGCMEIELESLAMAWAMVNSTTFFMPTTSPLRQTRNHWKQFYLEA